MLSKIKYILFILTLICLFFSANAQKDTVYIYEEVVVYDTIVVYDTVFVKHETNMIKPLKHKSIRFLNIDTVNNQANLLLISKNQTATFPINHIILNDNFSENIKNLESMKQLSFFSVVFFAFQTMVLAQTNYEVSIGTGIWWESGKLEYVDKPYSSLLSAAIFAKRNFTDKNFGLKTGIEYSYFVGSKDYKFDGTIGVWHSTEGAEFEDINSLYGSGMHNISVPILCYFDKYKIQPFGGLNYNYLFTGNYCTEVGGTNFNYFYDSHSIGLNCGVFYTISNSFSINIEYKYNLTSDCKVYALGNYKLRNTQVKLSIVFSFPKRNKSE